MPVSPTYPGVYIEEIPSGVHTITGVARRSRRSSGYTARGADNGRSTSSASRIRARVRRPLRRQPVSYAVKQFFQNGGTEA